jgi:hypothetical protein
LNDERDDEWDELEEQLQEEPLFITRLDKEDPYITFTRVFTGTSHHPSILRLCPPDLIEMETANPAQMNTITSSLTREEQKLLHSIVEQAKRNLAEEQEKASELSNGD